jgi:hypothetical protein
MRILRCGATCSLLLLTLFAIGPQLGVVAADQLSTLTNDSIQQMMRWHISSAEIIATIDRNDTQFDLSASTIASLKAAGVEDSVLEAMWKATLKSSKTAKPLTETAAPPTRKDPAKEPPSAPANNTPAHSEARLAEAKIVQAKTGLIIPYDSPCPLSVGGKVPQRHIQLDWNSGSIDPNRVNYSGSTCFEVFNFNDILYSPSFTLTEKPVSGNAIDLLTDAINSVQGINFGAKSSTDGSKVSSKAKTSGTVSLVAPSCPSSLQDNVKSAIATSALLQAALSQLDPGKDKSGNINLVPLSTSQSKWQDIPRAYESFQAAVSNVIRDLNDKDADVCTDELLAAAESVVIEVYLPLQVSYPLYASHADAKSSHVVRYTADLGSTSGYDLTVKATYPAGEVSNGTKIFSLSAGRKIASASGGFLITQIPARSYSSVTSTTGATPPTTQNVLGVNYGKGPQVALVGLVNFNLPDIPLNNGKVIPLNGRDYGLALSAGPTYGLTNGSSDVSKVGFFGGISIHLWNQFFLTPGVHVGQFSDFPQGYTGAGQVIPTNAGTPQGVTRFTTRFAFGITYKIKDFGATTTKTSNDSTTTKDSGTQPQPTGSSGSAKKKPAGN